MFDNIEDFQGDEIDFLQAMQQEINEIDDPLLTSVFQELEDEAIGMLAKNSNSK